MMLVIAAVLLLSPQEEPKSPLSPAEALKRFRIAPGWRIEPVASEPQVESPVAMAFDARGRLFVVEMLDYPTPAEGKPPRGRIKLLEDRDGDGRFERAAVFADRVLLANGVLPWKDGVIVTAAPRILHLRDTDGDGKADRREVLFEGFAEANPQLLVSHPNFGIDNWITVANGSRGGKVRSLRQGGAPVDIGGRDFRFDLVRTTHEAVSGYGQFGLTFDDWGRRFVSTNRNHLIPLPMEDRYFARNPHLPPPSRRGNNQRRGGAARVFSISGNKTLAASHSGTFTAACGVRIYRGEAFTCEPTGNLVHRETLVPVGAGFDSRPVREGVEFLASPDSWFRPVSLFPGPDGALYVVDMYRAEVEHPRWVPADQKYRYEFDHRKDLGRIWRVVPSQLGDAATFPDPTKATTEALVPLLASPNAWTRMTAHRLLLERQDRMAWGPLRKLAAESREPLARLHAVWLLEGHRTLDVDLVLRLLEDPHPRVRENALRLAERWIGRHRAVQERVAARAADPDARVRFRAALALGEWDDDRILAPLARIAKAEAKDPWTRRAVASAVPTRAGKLLARLEDPTILRELAAVVGSRRDAAEVSAVLRGLAGREPEGRAAALNGLAEGMGRRGTSLSAWLKKFSEAAGTARPHLSAAVGTAEDRDRPASERLEAIRLLAHLPWDPAGPALARLLEDPLPEARLAAVAALSAHRHAGVAAALMKGWKRQLPAMRREVLEAMGRRSERIRFLMGEVEAGRIEPGELGTALVRRLTRHGDRKIRDRARKAFEGRLPKSRQEVLRRYQPAIKAKGDLGRGREIFAKNCGACHRVAGVGSAVGPDISDTFNRTREALLTDILDPSRAIDTGYVNYLVRTKSGSTFSGFIAAQTASSLTLRRGKDQEDVILRADVEEMRASAVSVMPEGVEKNVTVEQMVDLLTFLKRWRD